MARRYASDTSVSISRSREQIDKLLREWGCTQIMWGDDFEQGRVALQFVWRHDANDYLARFAIRLPTDAEMRSEAKDGRSGRFSSAKLAKLQQGRGRAEHRQLALWLKAALNAVAAGIVDAESIFLPWLVGRDGRTVAETALPQLPKLLSGGASRLLLPGLDS